MQTFATKIILLAFALHATAAAVCGDGNDKLCRGCLTDTTCALCSFGFVSSTGVCQRPNNKVDHCVTYLSSGNCIVCDYGYFVNSNGQCSSIQLNNCARLSNDTLANSNASVCLYCKDNVLIETNGTCGNTKCATPNCKYCTRNANGAEICDRCNDDYSNSISSAGTTACRRQTSRTDDCYYVSTNGTDINSASTANDYCILCDDSHYLVNGACSDNGMPSGSASALSALLVGLLLALFA